MLTPEEIEQLSAPIVDVYRNCVDELLINIASHLEGGSEKSLEWQMQKLGEFGQLRRENIEIIKELTGDIPELIDGTLGNAIMSALDRIEPDLSAAAAANILSGIENEAKADEQIFDILDYYSRQAQDQCNLVNTVMLNSSLNQYRKLVANTVTYEKQLDRTQQILNRETGAVATGVETRTQALRKAIKEVNAAGLTGFKDAAGRNWSAEAYINMDIRTTVHNTALEATFTRNVQYGNSLISTSAHSGARELCYPYQGKIYSTDGTAGEVEDLNGNLIEFEPIENTSYGLPAGLFGINCGHMAYPFIPGMSTIHDEVTQSKEENDRQYKESQRQRQLERDLREAKREAVMMKAAGDKEGFEKAAAKIQQKQANHDKFIAATGRTPRLDRTQVEGYNRSISGQVTALNTPKALEDARKYSGRNRPSQSAYSSGRKYGGGRNNAMAYSPSSRTTPASQSRSSATKAAVRVTPRQIPAPTSTPKKVTVRVSPTTTVMTPAQAKINTKSIASYPAKISVSSLKKYSLGGKLKITTKTSDLTGKLSTAFETTLRRNTAMKAIEKQAWTLSLKAADRIGVLNHFKTKVNTSYLEFFAKYGDLVRGDFYTGKRGYYLAEWRNNPNYGKVYIDITKLDGRNKIIGESFNMRCFFHETGHLFDNKLRVGGQDQSLLMPYFSKLLKRDALNTSNKILRTFELDDGKIANKSEYSRRKSFADFSQTDIDNMKKYFKGEKHGSGFDTHYFALVSDLFMGASDETIVGGFRHKDGYFNNTPEHLPAEAWAEFTEAYAEGGIWEKAVKEHFPNAYKAFTDYLNTL